MAYPKMQSQISGRGQTVVLVPGGLTGWLSWEPHAKLLAKAYRVIRVQLLSVQLGLENEPLPHNYSVEYEIEVLKDTLDEMNIEQADFVAWSYGAEITLSYALHNANRVRSLTLIEPPAIWVLRSERPLSAELRRERRALASLETNDITAEQLAWFAHFAGFVPKNVDPKSLPQWPIWFKHRQSLRNGDVVFRLKDQIELVKQFQKPVLLFKGTGSTSWLHQIIDVLGKTFPKAKVVELPGGHAPQIATQERFLKLLTNFWNKLD